MLISYNLLNELMLWECGNGRTDPILLLNELCLSLGRSVGGGNLPSQIRFINRVSPGTASKSLALEKGSKMEIFSQKQMLGDVDETGVFQS